jgi:hypothetical protein
VLFLEKISGRKLAAAVHHPDFGLPVGNFSATNFGSVTQTSNSSRQVQFSLKDVFLSGASYL